MRPFLAGVLAAGVLFAPWWIPFTLGILMMIRFRAWEAILAAVVLDLVYGTSHNLSYALSLTTLAALIVLEPFRRRLASAA
jgi:hypothetical protein